MKTRSNIIQLPTRAEVLGRLAGLADGSLSPEEASRWAMQWIIADHDPITAVEIWDWPVWEALTSLSGADLQTDPDTYLHGTDDFRDWLEKLRNAPLPPDRPAWRHEFTT